MADILQMPLFDRPGLSSTERTPESVDNQNRQPATQDSMPPDGPQRADALNIQRSWVVEAPAGSGKTGLLVQRFLKLLAFGGISRPDEVLAITFTRKASAEMRHRILAELTQATGDQQLPDNAPAFLRASRQIAAQVLAQDSKYGWHLLDDPAQLNIRTIDSLCSSIAASRPMLSGAGARYTPVEDAAPLHALAAERTLLLMGHAPPSFTSDLERLLLLRDASAVDFGRLLAGMLQHREQWGELLPLDADTLTDEALDREVRPRLERTLRQVMGEEIASITSRVPGDLWASLAAFAHRCSRAEPYKQVFSPLAAFETGAAVPENTPEDLDRWKGLLHLLLSSADWRRRVYRGDVCFEISKSQQQELLDLIHAFQQSTADPDELACDLLRLRSLPLGGYPDDQWDLVKPLCRVLQRALVELQVIFAERHTCDFTEVSLDARSLLRHAGESMDLPALSQSRLRHLLVDEMQDTSAGQYDLLERLTEGWDGSSQTIFLVGDPKQSIYEFRLARVERFRRMMRDARFGQITVDPLILTANFRSQAALVSAFNQTFRSVFPSQETAVLEQRMPDVPFVAASAIRPQTATHAITWHSVWRDETNKQDDVDSAGDAAELQADQMIAVIRDYLAAHPKRDPSGRPAIAVLARARNHLAPILRRLRGGPHEVAIPFRAVDIEPLDDRAEVSDLLALTRALLDPSDRIAWLAVLRSPLCGLSLFDLLQLTGEGSAAERHATVTHLIANRASQLTQDGQGALRRTWPLLAKAAADHDRQRMSVQIERLWRSLGGDRALAPEARRNAERYLHLLREMDTSREEITVTSLQRRMERLYAAPRPGPADVELMTIHKAKGLEWDLVLVPRLEAPTAVRDSELLRWLEFDQDGAEGESGFLLAPIAAKGDDPSDLFRWMGTQQARREAAEAKRVFYVAATRAREVLHLFATVRVGAQQEFRQPPVSSLLYACWSAAQAGFQKPEAAPSPVPAPLLQFPETSQRPGLTLAATAESTSAQKQESSEPLTHRIPLLYTNSDRFARERGAMLPYERTGDLTTYAPFDRPEGSFEARAFGNTVHSFLPWIAAQLATGISVAALQQQVPLWLPRLQTLLRREGLSTRQASGAAPRVQQALEATLADPEGIWLLSPHASAANETTLTPGSDGSLPQLRADRTFLAGAHREDPGTGFLWIVDYKTGDPGGRNPAQFLADQHQKYRTQMEAYAQAAVASGQQAECIRLVLYHPLLPAMDVWPFLTP